MSLPVVMSEGRGGGDQSVIVRLSYEQLNTGHKSGISRGQTANSPGRKPNICKITIFLLDK